MILLYPLDQVRTLMQGNEDGQFKGLSIFGVTKIVVKNEGFDCLYRGIIPVVSTVGASNFIYFFAFHFAKVLLLHYRQKEITLSVVENMLLSSFAGIICVLSTAPFWVATSRIKMGNYSSSDMKKGMIKSSAHIGIFDILLEIWRKEGSKALWDGTVPSLILVTNPIIQFVIYEVFKSKIIMYPNSNGFSGSDAFILGAFAKTFATVATYPLQLAQNKLRIKSKEPDGKPSYCGTLDCLLKVQKKDGILGMFQGMNAKLLQTVLNAAFMFMYYEKIAAFVSFIIQ